VVPALVNCADGGSAAPIGLGLDPALVDCAPGRAWGLGLVVFVSLSCPEAVCRDSAIAAPGIRMSQKHLYLLIGGSKLTGVAVGVADFGYELKVV
jgi:hypothetical protein